MGQHKSSVFDEFTRKYALSKTLRFRLEPTEKTKELLEKNGIVPKDKEVYEAYLKIKALLDDLHREFIRESLLDFDSKYFSDAYEEWKKWKQETDKNAKSKKSEQLRGRYGKGGRYSDLRFGIVARFNETAKKWAEETYSDIEFKKRNPDILSEKKIIELLKRKFSDPEQVETISKFDRFFGYLDGYNQSRKNLYSGGNENTALAYRMVDVNLERYFANIFAFEHFSEYPGFRLTDSEKKMMNPKSYPGVLLQEGIEGYNESVGAMNKRINEYRQSHPNCGATFLLTLHNQILGQRDRPLFLDAIESDDDLVGRLEKLYFEAESERLGNGGDTRIRTLENIVRRGLNDEVLQKSVYFSKVALNTLLHKYLTDDGRNALLGSGGLGNKRKKSDESEEEYALPKAVSIADFRRALENEKNEGISLWKDFVVSGAVRGGVVGKDEEISHKENYRIFSIVFLQQFIDAEKGFADVVSGKRIPGHRETSERISSFLKSGKLGEGEARETHVQIIKEYLDSLLRFHRMVRYFTSKDIDHLDRNQDFYSVLEDYSNEYSLGATYDAVRNYLTKKPWSEEKILMTFDEGNLLGGWQESPKGNAQFHAYIFRKSARYYLGITTDPRLFDANKYPESSASGSYEKMDYRQLKSQTLYGSVYLGEYGVKYKTDAERLDASTLIGKVKTLLRKYAITFPELELIIDKNYADPKQLAKDVSALTLYSISWDSVSDEFVERGVYSTKKKDKDVFLYLFEICSKDIGVEKKTKGDLQALYWKNLFSQENAEYESLKLSGGGAIFFRPASIEVKEEKRKTVNAKEYMVIAKKRYTEDAYLFHCPIILNALNDSISENFKELHHRRFNEKTNEILASNNDKPCVLGLDRGEKHLVYYSLIGPDGVLRESGSFNEIQENGKAEPTDYLSKLEKREAERKIAREEWKTIGTIKELKNGYVSQVVRKVADLALQNNAVIVLEDLNTGFKRGRQKIERQVYQKFELALAKKLNYLVDKSETDPEKPGHPVNGLQLTPLVSNYQDIEKKLQVGIMLYTRAGFTSTTCPVCGWRRKPGMWEAYANEEQARIYLGKVSIVRNDEGYEISHKGLHESRKNKRGSYEIDYAPEKLSTHRAVRYVWSRMNGKSVSNRIDVTERLDELFRGVGIDPRSGHDLSVETLSRKEGLVKSDFYRNLLATINLLTRMRYTETTADGDERDMIHCPACDFRSDEGFIGSDGKKHEWNGDANGAYNIARKGRMMLSRISDFEHRKKNGKLGKGEKYPNLFISDSDWDAEVIK
ncbi:MAG: hypothetical protein HGB18_04510 [Candidatus Moranbacteria bacterium]|nr:hypothetical protein [Candidatus Moranbacteria bacterium]